MPKQKRFQLSKLAKLAPAFGPTSPSYCSFTRPTIVPYPNPIFHFSLFYTHTHIYTPLLNTFPHIITRSTISLSLFFCVSKMAPSSAHNNGFYVLMLVGIVVSTMVATCAGSFYQDFDLTWGGDRAKIFNGGQLLSLSLFVSATFVVP